MSSDKLDMSLGDIITSGRKNPKRGASNKKTPANRASPASNKKKTIAKGNTAKKTSTSNKKSNNNSKGAASPASKGKAANSNKKRQQVKGTVGVAGGQTVRRNQASSRQSNARATGIAARRNGNAARSPAVQQQQPIVNLPPFNLAPVGQAQQMLVTVLPDGSQSIQPVTFVQNAAGQQPQLVALGAPAVQGGAPVAAAPFSKANRQRNLGGARGAPRAAPRGGRGGRGGRRN